MKQKFEESLPDYETFKNMSCIMIAPKETSKKTPIKKSQKEKKELYYSEPVKTQNGILLNNTLYEPIIIKNLRALYKQYSENFSSICSKVLEKKYKPINKSIWVRVLIIIAILYLWKWWRRKKQLNRVIFKFRVYKV